MSAISGDVGSLLPLLLLVPATLFLWSYLRRGPFESRQENRTKQVELEKLARDFRNVEQPRVKRGSPPVLTGKIGKRVWTFSYRLPAVRNYRTTYWQHYDGLALHLQCDLPYGFSLYGDTEDGSRHNLHLFGAKTFGTSTVAGREVLFQSSTARQFRQAEAFMNDSRGREALEILLASPKFDRLVAGRDSHIFGVTDFWGRDFRLKGGLLLFVHDSRPSAEILLQYIEGLNHLADELARVNPVPLSNNSTAV